MDANKARELSPRRPADHADAARAEAVFAAELAHDPRSVEAVVGLSDLLRGTGRAESALALTISRITADGAVDHRLLVAHAETLKALDRMDEALAVYRRAAAQYGKSAVAAHNLAAQLGDMSRFEEAKAFARQALARGSDAPQTWAVFARALQGCNQLEESRQAYVEVLRRSPFDTDAHRELAQLTWMREADMDAALAILNRAVAAHPAPRLLEVRAMVRRACGDLAGAHAEIRRAARRHPHDVGIQAAAAQMSTAAGFPEQGLGHAEAAAEAGGHSVPTRLVLCEAYLGVGEAAKAEAIAAQVHAEARYNQSALAYLATAWRLTGDERYHALYDYPAMVHSTRLDVPAGWTDLEDYLADLASALERIHVFRAHPFDQSLVNGVQVSNLTSSGEPAVQAFFQAVAGPIRRTLQSLGKGMDPFRSRNTAATAFQGVWSVRLDADRGVHVDHVHPKGWMSSACYVALPPAVSTSTAREGWLRFGRPGVCTEPRLEADHHIRPEPGLLVLFPSYMWHGTLPFPGPGSRLTVAFDLMPTGS